ncbi:MAG TPA: hypothetical protein VL053_18380 [Arachidicoccus sp.]|nr:hypothetical protein [Arachidicoccus sp.]
MNNAECNFLDRDNRKNSLYHIINKGPGERGNRVIILSIAGFGKSMELQNIAAQCSKDDERSFPIFHLLKDYSGQSILQILSLHGIDWNHIAEENLLLILDGLDEIKATYLDVFIRELNLFADARPKTNIVVSSRFNFYNLSLNPLRGFEVFILDDFNPIELNRYLDNKIPGKSEDFIDMLQQCKLSEYATNPYYLVRLVRLFISGPSTFPTSKSEFFERILFERLEEESVKYNLIEDRPKLMLTAQEVAYCISMSNESSIDDNDLKEIIPLPEDRKKFHRYFLMNRNVDGKNRWSFEHKNLQEYLCALCLRQMSFDRLIKTITFSTEFKKIQPKFLNILSFLFSLSEEEISQQLFAWLLQYEPEILMRFEKSRISNSLRIDILKAMFKYYKSKGLFIYSSIIQIDEMADFLEIKEPEIRYLKEELFKIDTSDRLAFDILSLLERSKTPWVHRELLEEILFSVLEDKRRDSRIHGDAIMALKNLNFTEENVCKRVFASSIDLNSFEIRRAVVHFLFDQSYLHQYMTFLIDSIPIYIEGQRGIRYGGANEHLVLTMINAAENERSLLNLLHYIAGNWMLLEYQHSSDHFSIKVNDLDKLLKMAASIYKQMPMVLKPVYKIFRSLNNVIMDGEWFPPFKFFFNATCGKKVMFEKLNRYCGKLKDAAYFADTDSCERLIEDYKLGKINDNEMILWRNWMPRQNGGIHNWFYERLKTEFGDRFLYYDDGIDYIAIAKEYEIMNQEMLLDKSLFLSEIKKIFDLAGDSELTSEAFYQHDNPLLDAYRVSLAHDTIFRFLAGKKKKTYDFFEQRFQSVESWEWFQMGRIEELLNNKGVNLNRQLIEYAESWCKEKIKKINFANAITDDPNGGFRIKRVVQLVQNLYCLLNIQLDDSLLLKMLPSSYNIYSESEKSLSAIIVKRVSNRKLLKEAVLSGIRSDTLSLQVLENHYAICAALGYKECLSSLYKTIKIQNGKFYYSRTLTDFYLQLGGNIQDFQKLITTPIPSNNKHSFYVDWNWYLIEKMAGVEPDFVKELTISIIDDPNQSKQNKIASCRLLFQIGDIKALIYWKNYILSNRKLLFDGIHSRSIIQTAKIPGEEPISLLIDMLQEVYETGLYSELNRFDSVEDVIFNSLNAISLSGKARFLKVIFGLEQLYHKHPNAEYSLNIAYRIETIKQNFFAKNEPNLTIKEALSSFQALMMVEIGQGK